MRFPVAVVFLAHSWALVFDPQYAEKLADCGISFLDAPSDMLQRAMAYAGIDPTSVDPADLEKGADVLIHDSASRKGSP